MEDTAGMCSVPGCGNEAKILSRALCLKHYRRLLRTGSTKTTRMRNAGKKCSVGKCTNEATTVGMCDMHYERQRRNGDHGPDERLRGIPVIDRVRQMVDTSAGPDECHPWTGQAPGGLPTIYDGGRAAATTKSVRRLIAHDTGRLPQIEDQTWWVRMRDTCHPLCCNAQHMDVTDQARPGTRREA